MAKKSKGNRQQIILECTEHKASGQPGTSRYITSGRDHVKVVKSIKDPVSGKYSYKEVMIHKDSVKDFIAK